MRAVVGDGSNLHTLRNRAWRLNQVFGKPVRSLTVWPHGLGRAARRTYEGVSLHGSDLLPKISGWLELAGGTIKSR